MDTPARPDDLHPRGRGRTLQRVVLPLDGDPDVLALYIDDGDHFSNRSAPVAGMSPAAPARSTPRRQDLVLDRRRVRVPAGTRLSFATYFNAFPASFWRRWTAVEAVQLRIVARGQGTVLVYRSTAAGTSQRVDSARLQRGAEAQTLSFRVPLDNFLDGGWLWFDIVASDGEAVLDEADWLVDELAQDGDWVRGAAGSLTIGVTTFNRPTYVLDLLRQLAAAPEVMAAVDEVLVVDQGDRTVRAQEAFPAVSRLLGPKLRVLEQANLGGSGGFARNMSEVLAADRSRYVLLLDDDVALEPEGLLRGLAFGDLCRKPTIVGGHMFNLYEPSHLHSFAERVYPTNFAWGPAPRVREDHDFETSSLRASPWLHRCIDVDYNAWWMCLVPVEAIKAVGLSMPFFIKWDDAEYGLRAAEAGIATVTLPGMAVWHMPFSAKDDTMSWQAYFHVRNRIVTALLHTPHAHGGRLVRDNFYQQVQHLLAMQYAAVDLRLRAVQDVLSGPEHLHRTLASKLPELNQVRGRYGETRSSRSAADVPGLSVSPARDDLEHREPLGRARTIAFAAAVALRQLRGVAIGTGERPQCLVPADAARWWRLARLDTAVVTAADSASVSWYRRDRKQFFTMLARNIEVHQRLLREWPELSRRYRAARDDLVSPATWSETFEGR